jgi:hypothetical protein
VLLPFACRSEARKDKQTFDCATTGQWVATCLEMRYGGAEAGRSPTVRAVAHRAETVTLGTLAKFEMIRAVRKGFVLMALTPMRVFDLPGGSAPSAHDRVREARVHDA